MNGRQRYTIIRPGCCGKKRKISQCEWHPTYDGSSWNCKPGFGCKKILNEATDPEGN